MNRLFFFRETSILDVLQGPKSASVFQYLKAEFTIHNFTLQWVRGQFAFLKEEDPIGNNCGKSKQIMV